MTGAFAVGFGKLALLVFGVDNLSRAAGALDELAKGERAENGSNPAAGLAAERRPSPET